MLRLISGMKGFVVGRFSLPHLPEDFEPALAETTKRAGMGLALVPMSLVVALGPSASDAAQIGPEVDGGAQRMAATASQLDFADLATLESDRSGACERLQAFGAGEAVPVLAQL